MFNWKILIKAIFVFGLVIVVGIFEFSLAFSDLGPNETFLERFGIAVLVIFVAGLIIGYLYPKRWYLAGLSAWSLIIFGTLALLTPPIEIPEGVQTIRIKISEGQIRLSPPSIKVGGFYVEYINEGIEEHELAFFVYPKDGDITQMTLDNFNNERIKASLKPLRPGVTDVARFDGNYFEAGQYIILCLKRTQDGTSHISHGEIKEFTVE